MLEVETMLTRIIKNWKLQLEKTAFYHGIFKLKISFKSCD